MIEKEEVAVESGMEMESELRKGDCVVVCEEGNTQGLTGPVGPCVWGGQIAASQQSCLRTRNDFETQMVYMP